MEWTMSEQAYGLKTVKVKNGPTGEPTMMFTHVRRAPRTQVGAPVGIRLLMEDGSLWTEGEGTVEDISAVGIKIRDIRFEREQLPASEYSVEVSFQGETHAGIVAGGKPVRLEPGEEIQMSLDLTSFSVDVEACHPQKESKPLTENNKESRC